MANSDPVGLLKYNKYIEKTFTAKQITVIMIVYT